MRTHWIVWGKGVCWSRFLRWYKPDQVPRVGRFALSASVTVGTPSDNYRFIRKGEGLSMEEHLGVAERVGARHALPNRRKWVLSPIRDFSGGNLSPKTLTLRHDP